jgi:hypothetical protein
LDQSDNEETKKLWHGDTPRPSDDMDVCKHHMTFMFVILEENEDTK